MNNSVIVNLDDELIIQELKQDGLYDIFARQIERIGATGNRVFAGQFQAGSTIKVISYHGQPGDSGWAMITLLDPSPELVQVVMGILAELHPSQAQVCYIDDPMVRN